MSFFTNYRSKKIKHVAIAVLVAAISTTFPATSDGGLSLLSPQGGDIFHVGDSMVVTWALDSGIGVTGLVIELSPDNGKHWAYLGKVSTDMPEFVLHSCAFVHDSVGSNPASPKMGTINLVSDSCRMRIRDYADGNLISISNGFMAIKRFTAGILPARLHPTRNNKTSHSDYRLAFSTRNGAATRTSTGTFRIVLANSIEHERQYQINGATSKMPGSSMQMQRK